MEDLSRYRNKNTSKSGAAIGNKKSASGDGLVEIEGGTINATTTSGWKIGTRKTDDWGATNIYGGTFNFDPSALLLEKGYRAVEGTDSSWTVEKKEYNVTFNSLDGSAVDSQKVEYNGKIEKPEDPTREGYTFDGWYKGSETTAVDWETGIPVTGDMTLTAHWKKQGSEKTETSTVVEEDKTSGTTTTTTTETVTVNGEEAAKKETVVETESVTEDDGTTTGTKETTSEATVTTEENENTTVKTIKNTADTVNKVTTAAEVETVTKQNGEKVNTTKVTAEITEGEGNALPPTINIDATKATKDKTEVAAAEVTLPETTVAALKTAAESTTEGEQVKTVAVTTDVLKVEKTDSTVGTTENAQATFELSAVLKGKDDKETKVFNI